MRTEEIEVFKNKSNGEHRHRTIHIEGLEEIKEEISLHYDMHDWSLEYIECDGSNAVITLKSYAKDLWCHFRFKGIKKYSIDVDVLVRWVMEVWFEESPNIHAVFDGIGIDIEAEELVLDMRETLD